MSFHLESEMERPVEAWLNDQGLTVRRQYRTPWGVCDLVACRLSEDRVQHRLSLSQSAGIGSLFRVRLLNELPDVDASRRGHSVRSLVRKFGEIYSADELESHLNKLVASNHAVRSRTGSFFRVNGWVPLHRELIAIELKLSRIAEVVRQAKANRAFADKSYIALPMAIAERVAQGSDGDIVRHGLGLIGVTRDSCAEMISPDADSGVVNRHQQMHAVEQFWPAVVNAANNSS